MVENKVVEDKRNGDKQSKDKCGKHLLAIYYKNLSKFILACVSTCKCMILTITCSDTQEIHKPCSIQIILKDKDMFVVWISCYQLQLVSVNIPNTHCIHLCPCILESSGSNAQASTVRIAIYDDTRTKMIE